ncbi:zinc finger protein 638 isoform X2 [Melanerpes formicivorus]|uniref:zinc finger protein 638 isoform X2 n=1 Tax=Melanerpes formicivorus TaxID=211600 RepID=UPI00358E81DD
MFSPRGTLPQRPRGPNPSGAKPPGSFPGGGAGGPQRKPAPGAPQGAPPRCSGQETLQWTGSQRINVRVTLHRPDPRKVKEKTNLHQEQKGEPRSTRWDITTCSPGMSGPKPPGPARISEQNANAQNRYTPESASSILASFGLSNEDLEELSRYPDDQLTPENMPLILREIRMRKMGHPLPGLHGQSRAEEPAGGAAVKGKVIDYGHASKYGYTEDPLEVRPFNPEALPEEPLEARVYAPEVPGAEKREEFPREQSVPMAVPPPSVPCNPVFQVEDLIKQTRFQLDSSNPRPFFPAEAPGKVSGICVTPPGLPGVKPVSQPVIAPIMPPMMPPIMAPLVQPIMPPVMPPLVQQPMPQHVMPPMTQPPFPAEIPAVNHHERPQHESGTSQPTAPSGSGAAPKPFRPQAEEPFRSPFGIVKASWLPVLPQSDAQKTKKLPTPSMMNDYYATSPRIFPHMCSLCNIECTEMKDWILHQNTPSHIESCRHLRQEYPDWNPEAHSSRRNAVEKKENQTPRRRSSSASPSPRRSRGSSSSYYHRRSRSRSRSPARFRPRPRSRSPWYARRRSPRYRSRSPHRSRHAPRASPRPRRSSSHDRSSRRSSRSRVGSSGSGSSHGHLRKSSGSVKKPVKTSGSAKASKKDEAALPESSSSSPKADEVPEDKEPKDGEEDSATGTAGPNAPSYNRLLRKELLSCGTVLQISDLPDDGFSDQDIRKIVQPFGKVSDIIVLRSRNEAFLEMNYKEAVIAAVKYGEMTPVLVNGRRVKISVAEKPKAPPGKAKTSIKKKTQPVKKVLPSTKKDQNTTTKRAKSSTGKKEKTKKPASSKAKESSNPEDEDPQISTRAAVEGEKTTQAEPQNIPDKDGVPEPVEAAEVTNPAPLLEKPPQMPQVAASDLDELKEALVDQEATVTTTESEEATEPASKELDDVCVVLVSNLPEKGYSVEEVSNLAKPFGGLRDVLILSSHKKAYLEINRKSADSMVKFYSCFPRSLGGNQLCISMVPQLTTVKDEEAIFTALIKDSDPKVDTAAVHNRFVHLGNLPDDGYRELEAVCVGLRFGKVDNYVVLKNKNKAILQLDSAKSARSMYSFLQQYPYNMGDHTLTCTLSPSAETAEAEVVKKEVKKEEASQGSSGLKNYPEGSGVVQAAAAHPPAEASVAKKGAVPISPVKDELLAAQAEPSKSHLEGAVRESAARPAEASLEKVDAGVEALVASLRSAASESSEVKSEEKLRPPCSLERGEALRERVEPEPRESAAGPASEKEVQGEAGGLAASATEPPELSSVVGKAEGVLPDCAVKLAVGAATGTVPAALPPRPGAAVVQMLSSGVTQPTNRLDAPATSPRPDAVKAGQEVALMPTVESRPRVAMEKRLGGTGKMKPEDFVFAVRRAAEENPEHLLHRTGAETEKQFGKLVARFGAAAESAANAVGEDNEGSLSKAFQSEGAGPAKPSEASRAVVFSSSFSGKESSTVDKTILKAVVSLVDISKSWIPVQRNEHFLYKGGEQNSPPKAESQGPAGMERKTTWKEEDALRAGSSLSSLGDGSSRWRASRCFLLHGRGGNWRNSAQQERDSRVESRASSKQFHEGESRAPSMKRDSGGAKASAADSMKASKSSTSSSAKQKEEEELFPFNLDEFVTVDEVVEETESPVRTRRNPPRGKRKAAAKANSSAEPSSKRRKRKSSLAHAAANKLPFVTLDEIGEEEEVAAQLMEVAHLEALGDSQGLLVVDEVLEEEELPLEAGRDPPPLLPWDEAPGQPELSSQQDLPRAAFEEQDLKAEPLVTVDEIGEVEELPLNEPAGLSIEDVLKQKEEEEKVVAEDSASSQVPDDPSALVTVDEIQEDNEDNPLVTLDEDNEDEDDFLDDFNRLKEELNFVTVDEVGEEDEEEENTCPGKNLSEDGDKDTAPLAAPGGEVVAPIAAPGEEVAAPLAGPAEDEVAAAVAGPEETETPGAVSAEETVVTSKPEGDQLAPGGEEPDSQQKKTAPSGVSKTQSAPRDLDYLVPKAGFFCQICSLFYADEMSVKNHCKTPLHQQNMEKFMAKQKEEESSGKEQSWR